MFSLSTFQSEGHNKKLLLLKVIQKDITFNSDLDKRIQICSIGEGRVGITEYLNINSSFATFGQPRLQF